MINNCERCTKHTYHCCKADIPYTITDVMYMKYLATEKYKLYEPNEVYITKHPDENISVGNWRKSQGKDMRQSWKECRF